MAKLFALVVMPRCMATTIVNEYDQFSEVWNMIRYFAFDDN